MLTTLQQHLILLGKGYAIYVCELGEQSLYCTGKLI